MTMRQTIWLIGLLVGAIASAAAAEMVTFLTPSDDRWFYPFNFTPGGRPIATCFGAAGTPTFNDRDAEVIVAWSTAGSITSGLGADTYGIRSVRVTLTNQKDAAWPVDTTPDDWFTYDLNQDEILNADGVPRGQPGDTDGESDDDDPGRAIELFGAGFGPFYTLSTWTESSIFIGSDSANDIPRDPFPFVYVEETPDRLHVEDNVKGLFNEALGVFEFTPQPWAVGVPGNYTPGNQPVPFDVVFDLDLTLSGGSVRRYFREQLDAGRVVVIVTSLREASFMGSQAGYPAFFTKEGTFFEGAKAPRLDIDVCQAVATDFDRDCDVDAADLETLRACRTGPQVGPPAADCGASDLDGDQDVDHDDFAIFQRCYSGSGNDPAPGCDQ